MEAFVSIKRLVRNREVYLLLIGAMLGLFGNILNDKIMSESWTGHLALVAVYVLGFITPFLVGPLDRFRERVFGKIVLSKRWRLLAPSHFRRLLSSLVNKSSTDGDPRIDFTTFGVDKFPGTVTHLPSDFFSQFDNKSPKERRFDALVLNIEHLGDLAREGISFEHGKAYPIDLSTILPSSAVSGLRNLPLAVRRLLAINQNRLLAFPLTLGRNGVAIKIDAGRWNKACGLMGISDQSRVFDLDWITCEEKIGILLKAGLDIKITMPNWYLPAFSLLAGYYSHANPNHLRPQDFKRLAAHFSAMEPLLHPTMPFFDDLSQCRQLYDSADGNLIVLGGGSWLNMKESLEGFRRELLPVKCGAKKPFWQQWCECLTFITTEPEPEGAWKDDVRMIVSEFMKAEGTLITISDSSPASYCAAPFEDRPRLLPPLQSDVDVTRSDIERFWTNWVKGIRHK